MKSLLLSLIVILPSFLFSQEWMMDLEAALKTSAETNRRIILVFQGSDWCAPCIKLDREIWSTDEFKDYSKSHYVMLKADFPKKKANSLPQEQTEKNKALAEKYNKYGYFPFVVVLDKNGKVLGETGYQHISVEDYIKLLDSF